MTRPRTRRAFLLESSALVGLAFVSRGCAAVPQVAGSMDVYKDPSCGCCTKWVEHMRANGFTVAVTETDLDPIREKHKIPRNVLSCHTGLVGGYIIEGHVPAADVKTLLTQKPSGILGLAIPGMPASAPGMDMQPFQPFTVLTFDADGKTSVFAEHDKA